MIDTPIRRSALAAARRLVATPDLFDLAASSVGHRFDYDGWEIDDDSIGPALRTVAAGTARAHDVELVLGDERLMAEFTCRISASGSPDYYEGDDPEPGLLELGPNEIYGSDLLDGLRSACDMAEAYGWVGST